MLQCCLISSFNNRQCDMALIVQKYGGTSVANPDRIKAVADKLASFHQQGDQVVVVVSAMSGETNRLISLASEVATKPNEREMDVLVSTGEQVTIALLAKIGRASCRERVWSSVEGA